MKLVILSVLLCAVFGAEVKPVEEPSKVPVAAPYSAYPYGIHGYPGYHPFNGFASFPYTHSAYSSPIAKAAYSHQYHFAGPLENSAVHPYPVLHGSPYGVAPVPSHFGYPVAYDASRPADFGRSVQSKTE
ncbi:uncharacterized protein LOC116174804 [Photinus pyralis]|uniref:uncharacterized protein LOC116174804 n=1 Tax=Photinus pyralis TaxID=7054 RepID=UPI00126771C9|nr:uncharacterized protein LOC116174804 [Photinus pyralis]